VPSRIEIKAVASDPAAILAAAIRLSGRSGQRSRQEDVFYAVSRGHLKLRVAPDGHADLIAYERENLPGPKPSQCTVFRTTDSRGLKAVLDTALGVAGVVRKTRELFVLGQTRVHLDNVEGLGWFVELEVQLQPGETQQRGCALAAELMAQLGIRAQDLVPESYIDLLLKRTGR
jgi:predicted adenylyl cyclase CyaB